MNTKRLNTFFWLTLAKLPMKGQIRSRIVRMGGGNS